MVLGHAHIRDQSRIESDASLSNRNRVKPGTTASVLLPHDHTRAALCMQFDQLKLLTVGRPIRLLLTFLGRHTPVRTMILDLCTLLLPLAHRLDLRVERHPDGHGQHKVFGARHEAVVALRGALGGGLGAGGEAPEAEIVVAGGFGDEAEVAALSGTTPPSAYIYDGRSRRRS